MKRKSVEKGDKGLADCYTEIGIGAVAASVGILKQRKNPRSLRQNRRDENKLTRTIRQTASN